ncbi:uncharacterized protein MCAP_0864-like [Onthophagus taurus]|uniref:uncharacterized protein MCAP_0864-like n=1 Tax=Onthophagus taurus TaxID=166361 RepID=UPI0039BE223C
MDKKIGENKQCELTRMNVEQEKVVASTSCEIEAVQEIVGESNLISKENEGELVDIESFSMASTANVLSLVNRAIKDLINCKTKFDVKLSTTELKLEEATKHSEILQNRIDELNQDVGEMESRRALQNIDIEMLKEDFKNVPEVIKVLNEKCEEVAVRLNEAFDRKRRFDEEMRKLDLEESLMKTHYQEKKEILQRKLEEKKESVEKNRKMRQETLDEQKRLLIEAKNALKEKRDEKNKILSRIEDKKKNLDDMELKKSDLEDKKRGLIEVKEKVNLKNEDLKLKLESFKNELEINKNMLKESLETLNETNKVYDESKKRLDEEKNKNVELTNIVINNKEQLETLKIEGQKQLSQLKETCESYSNQIESLKVNLENVKDENETLNQKISTSKTTLTELHENISSNKLILDDLKAKAYTDSELFASALADLEINKHQLTELTNLLEDLQNTHATLKQQYETKKHKFDLMENVKKELKETEDFTTNLYKEKERFYKENKEKLQNDFETFMSEQDALINNEEKILEEKNVELKNLENRIEEINTKALLKKQYADQTYEKCNEIERENVHLSSVLNRMKMEVVNPRRDVARSNQPMQRGILKSPNENVGGGGKKVTFEPALGNASVTSQDSFDQMFKQFLDTDNVEEPKPAGELVDLTAVSPPQKDN